MHQLLSEISWLQQWTQVIGSLPHSPQVPLEACAITTPLALSAWRHVLISHPHQGLVHLFFEGIASEFRIGYTLSAYNLKSVRCNLHSALLHPEVITQYLDKVVHEKHVAGPFPKTTTPHSH